MLIHHTRIGMILPYYMSVNENIGQLQQLHIQMVEWDQLKLKLLNDDEL